MGSATSDQPALDSQVPKEAISGDAMYPSNNRFHDVGYRNGLD